MSKKCQNSCEAIIRGIGGLPKGSGEVLVCPRFFLSEIMI